MPSENQLITNHFNNSQESPYANMHQGVPGFNRPMRTHKHNVVFIHIPKNAGTTIRGWYHENFLKRHIYYLDALTPHKTRYTYARHHAGFRQVYGDENRDLFDDDTVWYTVVRNPWSRLYSLWSFNAGRARPWRKQIRDTDEALLKTLTPGTKMYEQLANKIKIQKARLYRSSDRFDSFENFVNSLWEEYIREGGRSVKQRGHTWFYMHTPQTAWFEGVPRERLKILRFERLTDDFNEHIRPLLGNPTGRLGHHNKGSASSPTDYRNFYTDEMRDRVGVMFASDVAIFNYTF